MSAENLAMFGCEDIEAFLDSVKSSFSFKSGGVRPVAMSMISDAQEEIASGQADSARQTLNRVKYLLSEA